MVASTAGVYVHGRWSLPWKRRIEPKTQWPVQRSSEPAEPRPSPPQSEWTKGLKPCTPPSTMLSTLACRSTPSPVHQTG